jgi:hypothetical protein
MEDITGALGTRPGTPVTIRKIFPYSCFFPVNHQPHQQTAVPSNGFPFSNFTHKQPIRQGQTLWMVSSRPLKLTLFLLALAIDGIGWSY